MLDLDQDLQDEGLYTEIQICLPWKLKYQKVCSLDIINNCDF